MTTDLANGLMPAAVFRGEGVLDVTEVALPGPPGPGQVLVQVLAAGVCGTDVQILRTPPGHPATAGVVLGHEFCGTVAQVGAGVADLREGDLVAVDPNLYCSACAACREGHKNHCERMSTLGIFQDGGFAPWCLVPAGNAYRADPSVTPEVLVFVEPLSCVVNALGKLRIAPGDRALVYGAGPMGQLFVLALRAMGVARVSVVEPAPGRREAALRSGACEVLEAAPGEPGWELVVDAVGACLPACVDSARTGGQVLLLGMQHGAHPAVHQHDITRRELTVAGSYIAGDAFPRTVRLLEQGALDPRPLITHRTDVAGLPVALDAMRAGEAIKILVTP